MASANPKKLENIVEAEGAISISDTHGNASIVDGAFKYANDNGLAVVINGDYVNDYHFDDFRRDKLGLYTSQEVINEFYKNKLGERDYSILSIFEEVKGAGAQAIYSKFNTDEERKEFETQYLAGNISLEDLLKNGKDAILDQIADPAQKNHAKAQIDEAIKYGSTDIFKKKFENIQKELQGVYSEDELLNYDLKVIGAYFAFMEKEAEKLAGQINQYDSLKKVIINKGNHEPAFFVDLVKQHLNDNNKIVDLNEIEGYYRIKSKNSTMSLAGLVNCSQPMPYTQQILPGQLFQQAYRHMILSNDEINTLLNVKTTANDIELLEDKIINQREYQRAKAGESENVDLLFTHGQVLVPMGLNQYIPVPTTAVAAKLSLEAKLTIEGHIHNKFKGKNSLGKDMVRAAGEEAVVIRKNGLGEIETEFVKVGKDYGSGKDNPISYDPEEIKMLADNWVQNYKAQMGMLKGTNANDNNESAKGSATA